MKWVRASERLPDKPGGKYFVRLKKREGFIVRSIASTMWKNGKHKDILFVGFNPDSSHFIIDDVYEWLDESPDTQSNDGYVITGGHFVKPQSNDEDELWDELFIIIDNFRKIDETKIKKVKSRFHITRKTKEA